MNPFIIAFTGICTSPLLWDNQHRRDLWPHFGRLRYFTEGIDFNDSGNNNHDNGWTSEHDERGDHRAEMFCLRNWDNGHKRAIGVIGNNTYNYYTQAEGGRCQNDTPSVVTYRTPVDIGPVSSQDDSWKLIMIPKMGTLVKYNISYYNVMNGNHIIDYIDVRSDVDGQLFLPYPAITSDEICPIVLFKVYRSKDGSFDRSKLNNNTVTMPWADSAKIFIPFQNHSVDNNDIQVKIYPNPVNDALNIHISGNCVRNIVQLFAVDGRLIFETDMDYDHLIIPMQNFDSGLYFVFVSNGKTCYYEKIIKN